MQEKLESQKEERISQIWDEYQVYSKDELNMVGDRVELSGNEKGKQDETLMVHNIW